MPGSTFGKLFQVTTWGESHGEALGVVIDGCPPGIKITEKDIQKELDRRKPGNDNPLSSKRKENDKVEILSGIFNGITLGTPISMMVKNTDARPEDYKDLKNTFRPGHADLSYQLKYGIRDYRGGGRASGRETVSRVMAGAVAKKILEKFKVKIAINVIKQGKLNSKDVNDSVGGILEIKVKNAPSGLGEPVFDKLNSDLAKALISIGGIKAIEFGAGFKVADMKGSQNNEKFINKNGRFSTKNNNAGGILGGISYGDDIVIRLAVKPPSSIGKIQKNGRHDISLIPRIIPVVESMTAITIVDHLLRQNAIKL